MPTLMKRFLSIVCENVTLQHCCIWRMETLKFAELPMLWLNVFGKPCNWFEGFLMMKMHPLAMNLNGVWRNSCQAKVCPSLLLHNSVGKCIPTLPSKPLISRMQPSNPLCWKTMRPSLGLLCCVRFQRGFVSCHKPWHCEYYRLNPSRLALLSF